MAIAGVAASPVFNSIVGTIGTSFTFVFPQKFATPQNILALPMLQFINESDDLTITDAFISEFVDNAVKKTGHFVGVAATKCTEITWSLFCDHSFNNPIKLIFFF